VTITKEAIDRGVFVDTINRNANAAGIFPVNYLLSTYVNYPSNIHVKNVITSEVNC